MLILIALIFIFVIIGAIKGKTVAFCCFIVYYFLDYGLTYNQTIWFKDVILMGFIFYAVLRGCLPSRSSYVQRSAAILYIFYHVFSFIIVPSKLSVVSLVQEAISNLALPFAIYIYIKNYRDVRCLIKSLFILFIASCMYGLYEQVIGSSPLVAFIASTNGDLVATDFSESIRFGGLHSTQCFFQHATSYGYFGILCLGFVALYMDESIRNTYRIKPRLYYLTMAALTVGIFLSASRASMAAFGPLILYFVYKNVKSGRRVNKKFLFLSMIVIGSAYVFLASYLSEIIQSIIHSDDSDVGSSTSMRTMQFLTAISYFMSSPLFGHGGSFSASLIGTYDMKGAESIWIPLMIDYGIFGIVCYLGYWIKLYKSNKYIGVGKSNNIFYLLLLLFVNTMTSVPGFHLAVVSAFVMIGHRMYQFADFDDAY